MSPLRRPLNPFDRWARSESGLHLPSRFVPRAAKRLHHIEKFGQCQCCCTRGCTCTGCLNGVAACCYIVDIGEDSYVVTWSESCQWTSPPDYPEITMSIADGTITVTYGGNTYSASLASDTNCLTISELELTQDGGAGTVYVSAAGNTCLECECYCPECGDTGRPYNATCCWTVYTDADTYYVLPKTDECLWEDTGACGASISIGGGLVTLDINGQTWTIAYGEEGAPCCDVLAFNGVQSYPIAYSGSSAGCEDNRSYFCIEINIAGIVPYNGDCGCPACPSIDGTYHSYSYNLTGSEFLGVAEDVLPLCTAEKPYWRCGYNTITYSINISTNTATLSIHPTGAGLAITMNFSGTYDPETMIATLSLVSQSGNASEDCDGSAATVTITITRIANFNCPDFSACPHEDFVSCEGEEWSCADDCLGYSIPNFITVTFPENFLTVGTASVWANPCVATLDWCDNLPDNADVVLESCIGDAYYSTFYEDPGSYALPDVGGGSYYWDPSTSTWIDDPLRLFVYSPSGGCSVCDYAYASPIYTYYCYKFEADQWVYYHIAFQWAVFYQVCGYLTFVMVKQVHRARAVNGWKWMATSYQNCKWVWDVDCDLVCEDTKLNCWFDGAVDLAPTITGTPGNFGCYPSSTVTPVIASS